MASKVTDVIAVRLRNEVIDVIERRAQKRGMSAGEYVKWCVECQVSRRHKRQEGEDRFESVAAL